MGKLSLLCVAAALTLGALFASLSARADSLSCSSANGVTRCTGSDGLDCSTVDGRMVCAPGAKGSCETQGDQIVCRNGSVTQTFRTGPLGPGKSDGSDETRRKRPGDVRIEGPGQRLSIQRDRHGQRLTIEQGGQRLHIDNGDLDPDED